MEKHTPATTRREVTLRDVAAAAGVSVWTASNTYSNPGRVAEATRQRVHAAARALGYPGPHPGARSLARGQTGMIAFVAVDDAEVLLGDPAAALVSRGLLTACERAGCSLVLSGLATGQPVDARAFFRVAGVPDPRVPTVVVDGAAPAGAHAVTA
ncbi:MAG: LacI family DNA-binding transcriptional regulator, partial [Thermoleophilia bacterium]|nr:LacI family DNA-binding transcriptional regulator [Thermoleophilia bacterium]